MTNIYWTFLIAYSTISPLEASVSAQYDGSYIGDFFQDVDQYEDMRAVVDKEEGQYLKHPTMVLRRGEKAIYVTNPMRAMNDKILMTRRNNGHKIHCGRLPATPSDSGSMLATGGEKINAGGRAGAWEYLLHPNDKQQRVRIKDSSVGDETTYTGANLMRNGIVVLVATGHWGPEEEHYPRSVGSALAQHEYTAKRNGNQQVSKYARKTIRVVAFGDSTTASRKSVDRNYSKRIPELLRDERIDAVVINSGVGGSHTGRLVDNARHNREHALDRFEAAVLDQNSDIVLIQFGINDSWVDTDNECGESRIPIQRYKKNLLYMTKELHARGIDVVLMTPNALGERYETWRYERLERYAEALREVARETNAALIDIWGMYEAYATQPGRSIDDLLLDGMHPNDEGHRMLALRITETLQELLDQAESRN